MRALLLLLLAAPAGAYSGDAVSFDEPEGWTVAARGCVPEWCQLDVYKSSPWFLAVPRTSGWAHARITFWHPDAYFHGNQPYGSCPPSNVRTVADARAEIDCDTVTPGCGRKTGGFYGARGVRFPRAPIGGFCGRPVGKTEAGGALVPRYQTVFDPENTGGKSASREFNRAATETIVLFGYEDDARIYMFECHAPRSERKTADAGCARILASLKPVRVAAAELEAAAREYARKQAEREAEMEAERQVKRQAEKDAAPAERQAPARR